MTTLQERLRHIASHGVSVWGDLQMEAADRIDALEAEIQILTAEREVYAATADRAITQVEALTKDAARYHWLREHTMPKPLSMVRVQVMYQGQYILRDGPELDADVDNRITAIAARKEKSSLAGGKANETN